MRVPQRTVQAVVDAAVDATDAALGWLAVVEGDDLVVVAAASADPSVASALVGRRVPAGLGSGGFVVQSGQPVALQPSRGGGDEGTVALTGQAPAGLVCVPCTTADDVVGVLQVIDKAAGGAFGFDDVELLTILGGVAGAALADAGVFVEVPEPARLAAQLGLLADADPGRYAAVASVLAALLHQS